MSKQEPLTLFLYEKFRFTFEITSLMILPAYKGAVFRGAFGNAFRRVTCAVPQGDCPTCLLRQQCLYVAFFEPPPPPGYADAAKFSQAPPPYVLNPPVTKRQAFHPGDVLGFELVLIGRAIEALPYFVYTFMEVGRLGLGAERGKYRLLRVDLMEDGIPVTVYDGQTQTIRPFSAPAGIAIPAEDDAVENVTLRFLTPLRLKERGKLVTRFTFPLFFERLTQRITLLASFYGAGTGLPDFSSLHNQAQEIRVSTEALRWYDWERYSRHQNTTMKFGGLRGEIGFSGKLGPFLPALQLGEQINVGQSTTFGLGRYEIAK